MRNAELSANAMDRQQLTELTRDVSDQAPLRQSVVVGSQAFYGDLRLINSSYSE
jgi:hypothetical protein